MKTTHGIAVVTTVVTSLTLMALAQEQYSPSTQPDAQNPATRRVQQQVPAAAKPVSQSNVPKNPLQLRTAAPANAASQVPGSYQRQPATGVQAQAAASKGAARGLQEQDELPLKSSKVGRAQPNQYAG